LEIPRIEIPQIQIKQIFIPRTRAWELYPTTLDIIDKPKIDYPVVNIPSFEPLEYLPDKFIPTDPVKQPEQKQTAIPKTPEYKLPVKKDKEFFIKCPDDKDLRIGMYASEDRLEKVIGHKISEEDGKTCITLFEESRFVDRWIPSAPLLVSTSLIAITAASSPLIANLLKNLIKTAIKKLTKKKDKST